MKSKLTKVTLTGADDTVDPQELLAISAKYPGVEWGILIGSQHGHRFPSEPWMTQLMNVAREAKKPMNLSLHICGTHLRGIAAGKPLQLPRGLIGLFQRCQLNWHAEQQSDISRNIVQAFATMPHWTPEIIFQMDGVNNKLGLDCRYDHGMNTSGLHDLSHGTGVSPKNWPKYGGNLAIGYAGGLGPDNLREELPKIEEAAYGDYWIDMETKLYEGLQFSTPKCLQVLEIACGWIHACGPA